MMQCKKLVGGTTQITSLLCKYTDVILLFIENNILEILSHEDLFKKNTGDLCVGKSILLKFPIMQHFQ